MAVVFAGKLSRHAFDPLFDGKCAVECAVRSAGGLPAVETVVVFLPEERAPLYAEAKALSEKAAAKPVRFFSPGDFSEGGGGWTEALLCAALAEVCAGVFLDGREEGRGENKTGTRVGTGGACTYFMWADTPFIDLAFSTALYQRHIRYRAEYTFADCYPAGLAPEIFAPGVFPVLAKMAEGSHSAPVRDSLFNVIKKDINSFDIETDVADEDVRIMRVSLACDNARDTEICVALSGINASNYAAVITERQIALRSRPAFYAFQISGRCPFECPHCPYPGFCSGGAGKSPGVSAVSRDDFMRLADFEAAVEKIAGYSEDAVVSLSLWGECAFHPDICGFIEAALKFPSLSVLIETTGTEWSRDVLEAIHGVVSKKESADRPFGALNWIVSLDAVSPALYARMHGLDGQDGERAFKKAVAFITLASALFPGCVYPQFLRMKENEGELEAFFRYWKETLGNVIIQKYDTMCASLPDRRPADLSPLTRYPCWHLKRDVSVLLDGSVPFCKEDIYCTRVCGNMFTDPVAEILDKNTDLYKEHINCIYTGMCGACDEYYTFNF